MAEAIGGLTGSLQGQIQGLANGAQSWLDKIVPPETRSKIMAWIMKFINEKPMLASFLASHIAISGFPLGLFMVMTIAVALFAIIAALLLGLLAALVFIVLCVGFALIFLLPTLFVTTAIATFIFLWGVGTYYILKYFNEKDIPGIHKPLGEGLSNEAKNYAEVGQIQGYGQDSILAQKEIVGKGEPSEEEKQGMKQREEVEKDTVGKVTGKVPGGDQVDQATKKVPGRDQVGKGVDGVGEKAKPVGDGVKKVGEKDPTGLANGVGGVTKGLTG
ncbi:uncharacterized protein KY384_003900 [Bacidia gigantensis]|uniref:uncharacterized protein n=1 Tax=Bacidia gigantensis TaxID=2732470 RepID=UPI001D04178C|nr:uncharacterized protein KY384_003900 [Bacidia gigantensis]KAG8532259.1 hypothetical protein KY384_003900 [Bacidia gigantensis]